MKSILVLLLFVVGAFAQIPDSIWSRAYGVADAHWKCVGMVRTPDGGFAMAGNQERGERESSMLLMKCTSGGDSLWNHVYVSDLYESCSGIVNSATSNLFLAGYSRLETDGFARFITADSLGDTLWTVMRYNPQDSITTGRVIRSGPNSVVAYSYVSPFTEAWGYGYFSQADVGGFLLFTHEETTKHICTSIVPNSTGELLWAGYSAADTLTNDDFDLRFNAPEPRGFERTYGGPARDRCEKIIATSDGGYLLAGVSLSYGQGDQDILLIKINEFGDSLWSQTFGGVYFDDFGSVVETSFGSYLVVGTHEDENDGNFDLLIGSCDANGGHRMQSFVGGTEEDVGMDIVPLDSGVVMFAGHTRSLGGDWRKLWLMRAEYRPHISIDRGSITFGAAQIGDSVVRTLNIYNAGGVELSLDSMAFPNGYHVNLPLPFTLSAGQELPLEIIFAPQQIGAHVGNMTVYSNALEGPLQVRLVGSGQGTAANDHNLLPDKAEIISLYPNPFNANSEIKFSVPQHAFVTLELFNSTGRNVQTLLHKTLPAGTHTVEIEGQGLATGLYFVRLKTPTTNDIRKLILLR